MVGWWVYITDKKGKYYVGITTNLANRMRQHGHSDLLFKEGPMTRTNAIRQEKILKGWSRKKKLDLIAKASEKK